jgi:FHS family L-fucose permease-like MFS transporter
MATDRAERILREPSLTVGADGLRAAFIAVTTLFFAWGFTTSMLDPLVASVKAVFSLSYAEAMLTQFAFFMAYFVVSLPGGMFVARVGYSSAILCSLLVMIAGCLLIPVATHLQRYDLVLIALFVLGSGITVLQVAANPLSAALGAPEKSHFRLTLSQAFNSLGTLIGPALGSVIMLRGGVFAEGGATHTASVRGESLRNIDTSFLIVAGLIGLLVLFIWWSRHRLREAAPLHVGAPASVIQALKSRWAMLGAAAIFLYVGAEVSIASIMINFLNQPDVLGIALDTAGKLLGYFYWGGAMVGRFVGSALLTRMPAARLLMGAAAVAAILCLIVSQGSGATAAVAAMAVGFFNSIMFPVIFTLTLERSTAPAASTSGLLCMAIVGGAILPVIVGALADGAGLHAAFLVPVCAYVFISLFAFGAAGARVVGRVQTAAGLH